MDNDGRYRSRRVEFLVTFSRLSAAGGGGIVEAKSIFEVYILRMHIGVLLSYQNILQTLL
jgi:hypothetical protein